MTQAKEDKPLDPNRYADAAELNLELGVGERARGIAAIHAYADWLAQHPDVPMPTTVGGVTHQHNDEQESVRVVRGFADTYGARKLTSGQTGWAILTLTETPVRVEHTIFTNTDRHPKSDWL